MVEKDLFNIRLHPAFKGEMFVAPGAAEEGGAVLDHGVITDRTEGPYPALVINIELVILLADVTLDLKGVFGNGLFRDLASHQLQTVDGKPLTLDLDLDLTVDRSRG